MASPLCTKVERKSQKAALAEYFRDQKNAESKTGLENRSNQKQILGIAKFKMEQWLAQNKQDLEERRDRLYTLLEDEEDCYKKEIVQQHEGRQANQLQDMRKRVTTLRANREEHQKKIVEEKLNQCFQSQCEQMRSLLSKRMTKEIVQDWDSQIQLKNRLEKETQAEEYMWACLTKVDAEEKEKRELFYNEQRKEVMKRGLEDLKKQVELKKLKKAEAFKIRLRELALFNAEQKQIQEEKESRIRDKEERFLRAKAHTKDMIETRNYYRDRKIKREEVAAREFLKKAIRDLHVEEEDRDKKKREMMRAIQIYRDYSRQRDCLVNEKEDVVQRVIDEVIEEQHKKTMEFRKREQQQRHELHCNVLAGRVHQIEDCKRRRAEEEEKKKRELELLKEDWKLYMRELEQEKAIGEQKQMQYRCDLRDQVQYQQQLKEREVCEDKRLAEMNEIEEKLFQNRLQKTLNQATLTMSNPHREGLVGKPIQQCFRKV